MTTINGDLIPAVSGAAQLGVDGGTNAGEFDITSIAPFGHIHQLSGVFHDPLLGQSGVMRYSRAAAAFQISVDGGLTFSDINTGPAGGVTSVGVLGDANLTGAIDLASPASGFIAIEDSSDASPLLFSVDVMGLSGLWGFPANGFPTESARCYAETFTSAIQWVVTHNLNTEDVVVAVYDASSPRFQIFPDRIRLTDADTVTITFNSAQAGRVVVIGCS